MRPNDRCRFTVVRGLDDEVRIASLKKEYFMLFLKGSFPISLSCLAAGSVFGTIVGAASEVILEISLFLILSHMQNTLKRGDTARIRQSLTDPIGIRVRCRPWMAAHPMKS